MISISPMKSMQLEFEKAKRKPTLLMVLFIILINLCYLFIGIKKNDMADFPYAWEAILFYFPLLNTIFLSVFMAVLASRTMDLEHKTNSWNLLQTLQSPSSLYLGKYFTALSGWSFSVYWKWELPSLLQSTCVFPDFLRLRLCCLPLSEKSSAAWSYTSCSFYCQCSLPCSL